MKKSKCKKKNNWSLEFLNNLHFGNKFPGQLSSAFPRVTRWLPSREAERKALSSCQVNCCEQVWDRTMSSQYRPPASQVGLIVAVYRRETRKDRAHTSTWSLSFSLLGHSHLTSLAHLRLQSLPSVLSGWEGKKNTIISHYRKEGGKGRKWATLNWL